VDGLTSEILTPALIDAFVANYVAAAGASPIDRASGPLRSAHSVLRNARALFDRDGMKCYVGLTLPDLQPFMEHQLVQAPTRRAHGADDDAVAEMSQAALALRSRNDPALYLVHCSAGTADCANDELMHLRAEWFEVQTPARVIRTADGGERQAARRASDLFAGTTSTRRGEQGRIAIALCVWSELQPFLAELAPTSTWCRPATRGSAGR
jgi:hypothetical protein